MNVIDVLNHNPVSPEDIIRIIIDDPDDGELVMDLTCDDLRNEHSEILYCTVIDHGELDDDVSGIWILIG